MLSSSRDEVGRSGLVILSLAPKYPGIFLSTSSVELIEVVAVPTDAELGCDGIHVECIGVPVEGHRSY